MNREAKSHLQDIGDLGGVTSIGYSKKHHVYVIFVLAGRASYGPYRSPDLTKAIAKARNGFQTELQREAAALAFMLEIE